MEQRHRGKRCLHALQASARKEASMAHTDRAPAVLHRSSLVHRIGRSPPHIQGAGRGEIPSLLEYSARALVHPLHLARSPRHAAVAARRANCLHASRRMPASATCKTTTGCASTTKLANASVACRSCPARNQAASPCITAGKNFSGSSRADGSRSPISRSSPRNSSVNTATSTSGSTIGDPPATTATSRWKSRRPKV